MNLYKFYFKDALYNVYAATFFSENSSGVFVDGVCTTDLRRLLKEDYRMIKRKTTNL